MKYLASVHPSWIKKIELAEASVADDKARCAARGQPYVEMLFLFAQESDVILYKKLASSTIMDPVWRAIEKMFDDSKRPSDYFSFADACSQTLKAWDASPKRTASQHKEYFETLARDIESVTAKIVGEPEFGAHGRVAASVSPLDQVDDSMIEFLLEAMDSTIEDGRFVADKAEAISYLRFCLGDVIPTLYEYMEHIAARAREISQQKSIASRPHRATARRTFFVKHLSNWFYSRFAERSHEIVAAITSVVFDDAVTGDLVSKLVKNAPEVSPLFRRKKHPLP